MALGRFSNLFAKADISETPQETIACANLGAVRCGAKKKQTETLTYWNHTETAGGSHPGCTRKRKLEFAIDVPAEIEKMDGRRYAGGDGTQTRLSMATAKRLERVRRALTHPRPVSTTPENTSQLLAFEAQ